MSVVGYHLSKIDKGELGKFSKIKEEYLEFLAAMEQKSIVMAFVELSDMLGAISHFLKGKVHHPNTLNFEQLYLHIRITHAINTPSDSILDIQEQIYESYLNYETNQTENALLDLLVALNTFMKEYSLSLNDLYAMTNITQRAFKNGTRQ